MDSITLYELNNRVRQLLSSELCDAVWVQAELSEVNVNPSGHCYVEMVQKDERKHGLLARARGVIWNNVFTLLKPYFEHETGERFAAGIKVLVQVTVSFHELYGYSLTITDINPIYTVGELVRNRREIMRRLHEEGVAGLNRELEWPLLPQRVAVISSATAAGYGDFCDQLLKNRYGYAFHPQLFAAVMQGADTQRSIIGALNLIARECDNWDVVAIIRGGGATSDLSAFDAYDLAANCAQFPLPIITGIGHERDETVLDMVANTRAKTPTAVAELLIDSVGRQAVALDGIKERLFDGVRGRMRDAEHRLQLLTERLPMSARATLQRCMHRLELWEQTLKGASPDVVLKRGYTLTLKDGHVITGKTGVKVGDVIETRFAEGHVESVVK